MILDVLNNRVQSALMAGKIPAAEGSVIKLLMAQLGTASALCAVEEQGASGMLTGRGVRGRSAISLHDLREFRLVSDRPLPFEVDGDYLGEREDVHFTSAPAAIRVIC